MNIQRRTVIAAVAAAGLPLPLLAQQKIVLGFSQIGAESGWRTAETESIKSAAKDAGIDLKFSDAQQKQENQIKAIRAFIPQKVDVIASRRWSRPAGARCFARPRRRGSR